jgi:quercetin dioxygenase-like cupin family protein
MNTLTPLPPVVTLPDQAIVHEAFGDRVTFHLTGEQTGGKCAVFSVITQPGGGPPLHWHENEEEIFHVVEGEAEFFRDGEWQAAPVGTTLYMPRGSVHTYRNAGATPLKMMVQAIPAGFDTFFARCTAEFHRDGGPDMARIVEISAEHGIYYQQG